VYDGLFGAEEHSSKSPDPPEPDPCPKCRDSSHRYVIVVDGHARWCGCDGAQKIEERDPDWLGLVEESLVMATTRQEKPRQRHGRDLKELLERI
jgi:hypothetical protein